MQKKTTIQEKSMNILYNPAGNFHFTDIRAFQNICRKYQMSKTMSDPQTKDISQTGITYPFHICNFSFILKWIFILFYSFIFIYVF